MTLGQYHQGGGGFGIGAVWPCRLAADGWQRPVLSTHESLVQLLRPIPPIAYIPLPFSGLVSGTPAFFLISLGAFSRFDEHYLRRA